MERFNNMVIAIGASVGGTEAILEIIKDLPKSTPGIVVVQHMPLYLLICMHNGLTSSVL